MADKSGYFLATSSTTFFNFKSIYMLLWKMCSLIVLVLRIYGDKGAGDQSINSSLIISIVSSLRWIATMTWFCSWTETRTTNSATVFTFFSTIYIVFYTFTEYFSSYIETILLINVFYEIEIFSSVLKTSIPLIGSTFIPVKDISLEG